MAPTTLANELIQHFKRATLSPSATTDASPSSLLKRATTTTAASWTKCSGCASSVNNKFYFALFAILGFLLVAGSLWFFVFARNGGFQYEEGDWADYKSAVLRRKGPDGRTVASSRSARSVKTGMTRSEEAWEQARWAAMSVVARDEKGRKGILAKRGWAGTHSCTYADGFTDYGGEERRAMTEVGSLADIEMPIVGGGGGGKKSRRQQREKKGPWGPDLEAASPPPPPYGAHGRRYKDRDVTSYARERPARVGGMNRAADGSHMDFSGSEVSSRSGTADDDARHARAERRALTEAEKMERQWRREARRAARELAREGGAASPVKRGGSPRKPREGREYTFSKPEPKGQGGSYLDAYRPGR